MDERGKVLGYHMTSQCASGSGQFLENIARFLGTASKKCLPPCLRLHAPRSPGSGVHAGLTPVGIAPFPPSPTPLPIRQRSVLENIARYLGVPFQRSALAQYWDHAAGGERGSAERRAVEARLGSF